MKILQEVIDKIIQHAQTEAPIEACGYLAGADGVITRAYPMKNIDASTEHFTLDPKEQFDIVRTVRSNNEEIYTNYHSHPETPARPSQEDIRLAFDPGMKYVIVSLADNTTDVKCFSIVNGEVTHEEWEIINND